MRKFVLKNPKIGDRIIYRAYPHYGIYQITEIDFEKETLTLKTQDGSLIPRLYTNFIFDKFDDTKVLDFKKDMKEVLDP